MAVIDTGVYLKGERVAGGLTPEEAIAEARRVHGVVWIGLHQSDADELRRVGELLLLHPLAVSECLRGHQRAKLEHYGDQTFLVLQPARYIDESETVEFTEIGVFVGPDFLVTVHVEGDSEVVDVPRLRERLEAHPEVLIRGSYAGLWAILESMMHLYLPVADGVENDIDEIEEQLFNRDVGVSHRIFKLQREVIDLQHATSPLVDMLDRLQQIVAAASGRTDAPVFRDLDDRARHLVARISGFRHTLDNALTVDATLADQARNEEMRRMTETSLEQSDQVKKISSWAAVGFAPTIIAGIYGMNFRFMPELDQWWGYPFALSLMVAASTTLYFVFKKRGWL
ncbi:magnesium and cobalt transport protein CorA [Microbacterium sp. RU33B]|uniref:magnesium and cobalt transport protein CorA n=1 Tax=Microbacterium sp. RU33B TaxID=1907390 RepID=UPI00095AFFEA|nr:magnesium and cobalt transport protein CorA [Microbacterium sp. RU33B]SIT71051.1 magnesium transporter [Microbacterium sp. RU33B]